MHIGLAVGRNLEIAQPVAGPSGDADEIGLSAPSERLVANHARPLFKVGALDD